RRLRLRRKHGRLRLFARNVELALLGLDDDSLRASMREVLAHGSLLQARPLQRQGLLRRNAQSLVIARFRIAHSQSSAASSSPATAASIARSSGDPPR